MKISKVGGRESLAFKRKVIRYFSITSLLGIFAHLNSVQMMPIYYYQENLKTQSDTTIPIDSTEKLLTKAMRTNALRLDWNNQLSNSPLAQRMRQHQNDCTLPLGNFKFRNRFGLGSDLHVWSQALCNAMHSGVRIRTVFDWLWMDRKACRSSVLLEESEHNSTDRNTIGSPFQCYFPHAELQCPGDEQMAKDHPIFDEAFFNISGGPRLGTVHWECPSILPESGNKDQVQTRRVQFQEAAIEFLFGQLSHHVIEEAKRQHALVFGGGPTPNHLITVHIRWGDKKREMKLLKIRHYLDAIHQLVQEQSRPRINIFLATEDPEAVQQFRQRAPANWKIYNDQFYTELLPYRKDEYNGVPKAAATALEGRMGTIALGSLLVALEADEFVLTTESNWSRLTNELRKNIVDPYCNGCTKVMDLKPLQSI